MFFKKQKKEIKITGTSDYIDVQIENRIVRISGEMVVGGFVCNSASIDYWLVPKDVKITEAEKEEIKQKVIEKTANSHMVITFEEEPEAVGWKAIEEEFLRVYKGQTNPKHYGTLVRWILGGNDPLDGISIYEGPDYWHFVSFGLTELYEKQEADAAISGYGYELTYKLKKGNYQDQEAEFKNVCSILQAVARLVFVNGEVFSEDEYIYTGQTQGIDACRKSILTGFILVKDPCVNTIETPNGQVEFLELVGMTDAELKTLSTRESVRDIYGKLGSDITDYERESVV